MKENPKVKFVTLGCKVNQYETQAMRESLRAAGAVSVAAVRPEKADIVVVNTCTVTADADRENRYWIRRVRRENPNARIVVTGCGVVRNRADYESLPEVDLVVGNDKKAEIANVLPSLRASEGSEATAFFFGETVIASSAAPPRKDERRYLPLSISETEGSGRAFVKIQDGCNHACSFCKVVLVRGRSRSRSLHDIIEEVVRLRDAGYREIVFAGIQLGAYGFDFDHHTPLEDVLESCAKIEGIERLRLSSIEPTDVRPSLIQALRGIPKCCHQLHIPLQSGDDEILKKMNRRYGRSFYLDLISRLRSELDDFCLTLDVMAGFPGEEEKHFQNTVDLLRQVQPLKCHVFPYSRREDTRAAKFADLPAPLVRRRVQSLIALGEQISREVRTPYLGRTLPVLVESFKEETGFLQGFTANYLRVQFPGLEDQISQFLSVQLEALEGEGFRGRTA